MRARRSGSVGSEPARRGATGCLILVGLAVLAVFAAGIWWLQQLGRRHYVWVTDVVEVGDTERSITAVGALSALTTVNVGCQVSGIIASIAVDYNQQVRAGQLIAEIDPAAIKAQVLHATANLESARANERQVRSRIAMLDANLVMTRAEARVQEAAVKKARAALDEAGRVLTRTRELHARRLVAQAEIDTAVSLHAQAQAALEAAEAQVIVTQARVESVGKQIEGVKAEHEAAQAQVRQTEAQLDTARINLDRTRIHSPIDGVVIARHVDVGQTVAANFQTPTLLTIAHDLRQMQINIGVGEIDIGAVEVGQPVWFTVEAQPGREFAAAVGQVRSAPNMTAGQVTQPVTYPVMVDVDNADLSLLPGMTANVTILVDRRSGVLRMPTVAMYFKPPADSGLRLPSEALDEIATDSAWVWLLPGDGMPQTRHLRIGLSNHEFTEVIGPFSAGEPGVASGDVLLVGAEPATGATSEKSRLRRRAVAGGDHRAKPPRPGWTRKPAP